MNKQQVFGAKTGCLNASCGRNTDKISVGKRSGQQTENINKKTCKAALCRIFFICLLLPFFKHPRYIIIDYVNIGSKIGEKREVSFYFILIFHFSTVFPEYILKYVWKWVIDTLCPLSNFKIWDIFVAKRPPKYTTCFSNNLFGLCDEQ